ncbi:BQ2448_4174 [Microbotryum intermedium]|uniref:Mediator of RNA polymerase II transcription subunit 21 n=1 Tax=Microbotryum intermedium TaxID=269621 RepID=A0A238FHC7_9BASI|nr:BQ2448_4174 [Microbotryum intermedium]
MQDLPYDELSHMDRLTQAADSVDDLIKIMYSTLSYLTRKANFKPLDPKFPITQTIPDLDPPHVFQENTNELVADFIRKAKQLEYLIAVLPTSSTSQDLPDSSGTNAQGDPEFEQLEKEIQQSNREYLEALQVAETLYAQIQASLKAALATRTIPPPAES